MFSFAKCAYLFSVLATTVYSVVLTTGCNQGTEDQDIKNALNDVEAVAKAAAAALVSGKINGKDDVFSAAFDPLFTTTDRLVLAPIFTQLSTIQTGSLFVMIYCTESHIKLGSQKPQRFWEDTAYVNKGSNRPMNIPIGGSISSKPGAKGSYTTLGFKHSDKYDTSGTAHIYIADSRRHPPADGRRDLRRYPDIVKDGLDGKHNILEEIKPLAQTVMHELIHAVGGLIEPDPNNPNDKTKRRMRINDGPTKDTYGWLKCNQRRVLGSSNVDIADCITFLAQAIFLQIQGKDTYWTTGEVDPATLRPKNLPKP